MRSPCLLVHETRLSAVFKAHPSLLAAKCDKHCELVGQFFIPHESESHRESHSICTRGHFVYFKVLSSWAFFCTCDACVVGLQCVLPKHTWLISVMEAKLAFRPSIFLAEI